MCLNGLWLVAARFGPLWSTVLVIVLLLIVLARVIVLLGRRPARGWLERAVVDGANGLQLVIAGSRWTGWSDARRRN